MLQFQIPEWVTPASTILLGLFGGAGATLLWELWLKPRRERKQVARALSAEVSLNLRHLVAMSSVGMQTNRAIPADFELSTLMFEAIADRVGELPLPVLSRLIPLYNRFRYLNRAATEYGALIDKRDAHVDKGAKFLSLASEVNAANEAFYRTLETTIERADALNGDLYRVAEGLFRRWRKPRGKLTRGEMDASITAFLKQRKTNLENTVSQSSRPTRA